MKSGFSTSIDFDKLIRDMIGVAEGALTSFWKQAEPIVKKESKRLMGEIQRIVEYKSRGILDEDKARLHFQIQVNTSKLVILTVQGLALIQAENAINAMLDIIRKLINTAIGWELI
jgi:hypothetical protein